MGDSLERVPVPAVPVLPLMLLFMYLLMILLLLLRLRLLLLILLEGVLVLVFLLLLSQGPLPLPTLMLVVPECGQPANRLSKTLITFTILRILFAGRSSNKDSSDKCLLSWYEILRESVFLARTSDSLSGS